MKKYKITEDCVGCGTCVAECPLGVIVEKSDKCQIIAEKCDGCGACVEICPVEAIVEA